jgi:hypothetical protein
MPAAWTSSASPTACPPTSPAAPTCWCLRRARAAPHPTRPAWRGCWPWPRGPWPPAFCMPSLPASPPPSLLHRRCLTRGASARACCTSWRRRRPRWWRGTPRRCPSPPPSTASPSRCGWGRCWALTAARPTGGGGAPTTRGWSWARAGGRVRAVGEEGGGPRTAFACGGGLHSPGMPWTGSNAITAHAPPSAHLAAPPPPGTSGGRWGRPRRCSTLTCATRRRTWAGRRRGCACGSPRQACSTRWPCGSTCSWTRRRR